MTTLSKQNSAKEKNGELKNENQAAKIAEIIEQKNVNYRLKWWMGMSNLDDFRKFNFLYHICMCSSSDITKQWNDLRNLCVPV